MFCAMDELITYLSGGSTPTTCVAEPIQLLFSCNAASANAGKFSAFQSCSAKLFFNVHFEVRFRDCIKRNLYAAVSEDELILLETGRDLRPDSVVPTPDITPTEAAVLERFREIANDEELADEFAMNEEIAALDSETETSAPAVSEDAASSESTDDEKRNASSDDAAN